MSLQAIYQNSCFFQTDLATEADQPRQPNQHLRSEKNE